MTIITCPDPACGAPAEIIDRFSIWSTSGTLDHVRTCCLHRHFFLMPAHWLAAEATAPTRPTTTTPARRPGG